MTRSARAAFGVAVTVALVAVAGGAAGKGARAVTLPGQVRAFVGGEMGPGAVNDPPPEADLREMRLSPAEGGGYTATLTFAAPDWKRISTYDGRTATHQVFVSLQPPSGARMRVHLNSDGVATIDRAEGDRFVKVTDAVARPEGPSVVFEIAPSVGMTADWEVQGHALVRNAAGVGVHAHTAQVRAGSLSGDDGRVLRLPAAGTRLDRNNVPLLWEPRAPMPRGMRPVSVAIVRRTGGLSIDITMDAPSEAATIDGQPAALQVLALVIGAPGPGSYTLLYNPIDRSVFAAIDGGAAGELAATTVTTEGTLVRIRVPEAAGGSAAGKLDGAVPVALRVPRAQSSASPSTPSPSSQAGPPVPPVGPDTDLSIGAIVVGSTGGVAIETPVVPAGDLLPPAEPASDGSGVSIALLLGVLLVAGGLIARRMMRGDPSVSQSIDANATDGEQRVVQDCSELEAEVRRKRQALEAKLSMVERARSRRDAAEAEFNDVRDLMLGAAGTEFGKPLNELQAGGDKIDQAYEPVKAARTDLDRATLEASSAQSALEDAERRLKECLEAANPSVISEIDEVAGPFV